MLKQYLDSLSSYTEGVCSDMAWESDRDDIHTVPRSSTLESLAGGPMGVVYPDLGLNQQSTEAEMGSSARHQESNRVVEKPS